MDLELWVPALLDRAGNRKIAEGGPGYVAAYKGIDLLEVPTSLSRSQGDIHVDGNPHIHTDPLNGIIIARNILAGLQRVSPGDAAYFATREQDFEKRVLEATMGPTLVTVADAGHGLRAAADRQAPRASWRPQKYQGKPLSDQLGGWLKQAQAVPGKGDGLLPQGVGLLQPAVRGRLRHLHRGQAGDPADPAGTCRR